MNLQDALVALGRHEGGFSLVRADPGNWTGGKVGVGKLKGTKYGISAASYPKEDIRNLTWERATFLYERDFWNKAQIETLPNALRFDVFDGAVHSGPKQSVKFLQQAIGADVDGDLGPQTLHAVASMPPDRVIRRFNGVRLAFLVRRKNWKDASGGWANRIAANLMA